MEKDIELAKDFPRRNIIKMPEPPNEIARLQTSLANQGMGDWAKVQSRSVDPETGNVKVQVRVLAESTEELEKIAALFDIKLYHPTEIGIDLAGKGKKDAKLIEINGNTALIEIVLYRTQSQNKDKSWNR